MKKIAAITIGIACICSVLLCTCSKAPLDNSDPNSNSNVAVRVKDAPSVTCQQARIEIKGIQLYTTQHGWISVPMDDTIMDMLQLQDTSALMGTVHLGAVTVTQVQVSLGTRDTVNVGGVDFVLTINSGTFAIPVNYTVTATGNFTLVVDINAIQSIWDADNNGINHNYNMTGGGSCSFGMQGH